MTRFTQQRRSRCPHMKHLSPSLRQHALPADSLMASMFKAGQPTFGILQQPQFCMDVFNSWTVNKRTTSVCCLWTARGALKVLLRLTMLVSNWSPTNMSPCCHTTEVKMCLVEPNLYNFGTGHLWMFFTKKVSSLLFNLLSYEVTSTPLIGRG